MNAKERMAQLERAMDMLEYKDRWSNADYDRMKKMKAEYEELKKNCEG